MIARLWLDPDFHDPTVALFGFICILFCAVFLTWQYFNERR